MRKQNRSVLQQTIRDIIYSWVSDILADDDITDEMRVGYRDILEAAQDDDDTLDIMVEEHFQESGLKV